MLWKDGRRSDNVEDRRGMSVGKGLQLGGIGTVIITLIALYFGVDPSLILNQSGNTTASSPATSNNRPAVPDELSEFVSVVLADTETTWHKLFAEANKQYREPKLVLFSDAVQSACGLTQAAVGPFYCPADEKVYIDLSFYRELRERFMAPGDFAQAYVIAHEVGHHVQNLLGISEQVQAARGRLSEAKANQLSVKQELQADCLAGIWAHHANKSGHRLEAGDVEEAMQAATSIGDDRLQMQSRGYVAPESFTHGTSEQRVHWFQQGLKSGAVSACNTFKS